MDTYRPGQLSAFPGFIEVSRAEGRARLIELLTQTAPVIAEHNAYCSIVNLTGLAQIGKGAYRDVYQHEDRPGVVYKVPHSPYREAHHGIYSNLFEHDMFLSSGLEDDSPVAGPVAECKILWHESGLPVVVMEEVITGPAEDDDKVAPWDDFPEWSHAVDGCQVGWSAIDGWVIYDAGVPEAGEDDWEAPPLTTPRWIEQALRDAKVRAA